MLISATYFLNDVLLLRERVRVDISIGETRQKLHGILTSAQTQTLLCKHDRKEWSTVLTVMIRPFAIFRNKK